MSGRHSWSLQATDRLQDRLGDVAGSFKRQQEQQGSQTLKADEQLSPGPALLGGCDSVTGLSNQVRRLPSPLRSGKVLVKHRVVTCGCCFKYKPVCSHGRYNSGCWLCEVINQEAHLG